MSNNLHPFTIKTEWTGNIGTGTSGYTDYNRNHIVSVEHKVDIQCSTDPLFKGDATKHNPEDFFISALSTCHMLWYLHLCADAGIIVTAYTDQATGILDLDKGKFIEVTLKPNVIVSEEHMIAKAISLHHDANSKCFIANSCNFEIKHQPTCGVK